MFWSRRGNKKGAGYWLSILPLMVGGGYLAVQGLRALTRRTVSKAVGRIMEDPYHENFWEVISAGMRPGPQDIVETSLRAARGGIISRPFGSPRSWPNFHGLVFNPAQLNRYPEDYDVPVEMSVALGPRSKRPLRVQMPLLIGGLAYGIAMSREAKIAIARGTAEVGTATNSGEGPVLPEERDQAEFFILQYGRGPWQRTEKDFQRADLIELHFGQGATGGVGDRQDPAQVDARLRREQGLGPNERVVTRSRFPELQAGMELTDLVEDARALGGGVPIGAKIAAGGDIEQDLDRLIEAGIDVISIDGAQGATKGSPPILQDDFGIPTLHAVVRARRHLERLGRTDDVSLVVGGGLYSPGDYLKALALGADAVYIASMAIYALSHTQVFRSLPWEPPTQMVYHGGKQAHRLNVDQAAEHLANYLRSCAEEMAVGVRALGKRSIHDLSPDDLMALDPTTAEVCGVAPSYQAPNRQPVFS